MEARPGYDAFVTDMQVAAAQMAKQVDFAVAVGGKVRVPAFRRHGAVATSIPIENAFPEPGTGCDQGEGLFFLRRGAGVQYYDFIGIQEEEPMGRCFKVVEQAHLGDGESLRECRPINEPGKIGGAATVIDHRPCHAEARRR